ncbi:hypothetical protein Tco_0767749 [Tanacetum coccineum]
MHHYHGSRRGKQPPTAADERLVSSAAVMVRLGRLRNSRYGAFGLAAKQPGCIWFGGQQPPKGVVACCDLTAPHKGAFGSAFKGVFVWLFNSLMGVFGYGYNLPLGAFGSVVNCP